MRTSLLRFRVIQRLLRILRPYLGARTNWTFLSSNTWRSDVVIASRGGPKVLIATSTGGNWACSSLESLLGAALTLRGADVSFLLCDGVLPACQECDQQWLAEPQLICEGAASLCSSCHQLARKMLEPLDLPILTYSQFMCSSTSVQIEESLDEHSIAGALRYYGRGTLPQTAKNILDRYRSAAAITAQVIRRLIGERRPDVVVFHHGIYVPQGVVGSVLREAGIRVVNWGPAYRKATVLFSHGDTYHHTMINESALDWANMPWDERYEMKIMSYLRSRWTGANDWISFQPNAELDAKVIANQLGLDLSKPIVGLLTNVIWDAQLHFKQSAFPSMLDWLFASIEYFKKRTDVQWVIRVHPAEIYGTVPSRQLAVEEIAARFGKLPDHIKLVGPDDKSSTYSLMAMSNAALAYGTKTALELACNGLPVVVAGDAWCRGKGFTIDVSSPEQYFHVLETLPFHERLSQEQVTAARKYAYHFFFRRMIPVKALKPQKRFAPYKVEVDSIKELMPGQDFGLDIICDGILNGTPFVYDEPHS